MIRAIIFDFGQTLVDSSNGFRLAEKEAERQIFSHLKFPSWNDFLADYRKIRKDFHTRSEFSRASLWRAVYDHYGVSVGFDLLDAWEDALGDRPKRDRTLSRDNLCANRTLLEISTGRHHEPAGSGRLERSSSLGHAALREVFSGHHRGWGG